MSTECPNTNFISYTFSETSPVDILFRVYTHLIEMLQARKYTIDEDDLEKLNSIELFKEQFENSNDPDVSILQFVVSNGDEQVGLFFSDLEKIGMKQIKSYINFMDENEVNHSILILKYPISTFAKKAIDDFNIHFNSTGKRIEYFDYSELLINITKHILVPTHTILTEVEKEELLKRYSLKRDTQLPKLLSSDPISRYYGLRKGQVVKVLRQSLTSTSYVTYRIVV